MWATVSSSEKPYRCGGEVPGRVLLLQQGFGTKCCCFSAGGPEETPEDHEEIEYDSSDDSDVGFSFI